MLNANRLMEAPARTRLLALWRMWRRHDVPVLFLHGVLPDEQSRPFNASGKFITPRLLKRLLAGLSRCYRFVSLDDYLGHLRGGRRLARAAVLTIDDGYANNYEYAFPLLNEMGIPFAVFVATGLVDTNRIMWSDLLEFAIATTREVRLRRGLAGDDLPLSSPAEREGAVAKLKPQMKTLPQAEAERQVAELCRQLGVDPESTALDAVRFLTADRIRVMRAGGVTFGSHTVNHAILSRECADDVRREVTGSRERLESILGESVRWFAYPNGKRADFDAQAKRALREAGYVAALSTIGGISRPGDDPFEIRRYPIDSRFSFAELETRISGLVEFVKGAR